jgi:hypothetical protein
MNTDRSVLSRFMNSGSGMSSKVLDRLAEVLDLHLVVGSKNGSAAK